MFKRGAVYWTCVRIDGKEKNISLRTKDPKLARQTEAQLKLRLRAGATGGASHIEIVNRQLSSSITVSEAFARFTIERPHRVGDNQVLRDKASQKKLEPFFGCHKLCDVTQNMIHEYKMKRYEEGVVGATINREWSCLSSLFTMAMKDWGVVNFKPCHGMRLEPETARDRVLTDEEEVRLLAAAEPWMRELIIHALESGMREGPIFALEFTDIDLFNKRIRIRGATNKGNVSQVIPLSNRLYEQLRKIFDTRGSKSRFVYPNKFGGMRKGDGRFGHQWRELCRNAGIEKLHFHDLRRTFATRLYEGGVDIEKVSKFLGHSSTTTTEIYIKRKFNFLDDALEPLNRRGAIPKHSEVTKKKGG